jgi:hypothetical protein
MNLKQGSDLVYQYAQKFNSLCQYGDYHVVLIRKRWSDSVRGLMESSMKG